MLHLEVVGPGGSLSTSLATTLNGETPVGERPGRGQGDSGIQLRPDSRGALPLAGVHWQWQRRAIGLRWR
jgi:hypothetical protein